MREGSGVLRSYTLLACIYVYMYIIMYENGVISHDAKYVLCQWLCMK